MALGDTQIGEQQCDGLGAHRGAAIGVQGELILGDRLFVTGGGDQLLGELGTLAPRGHRRAIGITDDVDQAVPANVEPPGAGNAVLHAVVRGVHAREQYRILVVRFRRAPC